MRRAIATKIIDLAKVGERNPDLLCEQALRDIRRDAPVAVPKTGQMSVELDAVGQLLHRHATALTC